MAEAVVEIVEPVIEESKLQSPIIEEPEPKKKGGRPAGAKDKAPRTRKKITIVEEPLEPPARETPPEPEAPPKPTPKALPRLNVSFETPAEVEEPPSPRTVMKSASLSILQLRHLTDRARKTHLQDMHTKKLHSF
jgi:hypothetical protein